MDFDEMVKNIVSEIVAMADKKVLLFITGGAVNIDNIFKDLSSFDFQYEIVMTDAARKVIPREYIDNLSGNIIDNKSDMVNSIKKCDFIIIPVLTRNTLSKISLGISDNLLTLGISEALMMGKRITAVNDSFDPSNEINIKLGYSKNPIYNDMIMKYEGKLVDLGINFVTSGELKEKIKKCFFINEKIPLLQESAKEEKIIKIYGKVLTLADLLNSIKDEKCICINIDKNAIITPLAKDYISNNNIDVRYS